jgi:glycosyltransferase involved in cell wall biosynthesis
VTLPETLASLERQTFRDFEAVVVDDASGDGTAALVADLAVRDPRFRLVRLPERAGVGGARNTGLAAARGEWVLFLDADDWLLPEHIEGLISAVAEGADGAVSGYRFAPEAGGEPGPPSFPDLDGGLFHAAARGCPFPIHAPLVRRRDVLDLGGFDTGLEVGEDWDLWQRFGRAGKRLVVVEAATTVYRCARRRPPAAPRAISATASR